MAFSAGGPDGGQPEREAAEAPAGEGRLHSQGPQQVLKLLAPAMGNKRRHRRPSYKGSKDEKEISEAIEEGRKMLWACAGDNGLSDAQKRQYVDELLARWNPMLGHIPSARMIMSDWVFSGLKDEVNIILAGTTAEEEDEEEAGSSGTEEESEEEEAEEEADWDFENFWDYEEDSDEALDDGGQPEREAAEAPAGAGSSGPLQGNPKGNPNGGQPEREPQAREARGTRRSIGPLAGNGKVTRKFRRRKFRRRKWATTATAKKG